MDLQTRKLNVIEYVIRLQDANMMQEIEDLISDSNIQDNNIQQFTENDLIQRAKESNKQYKAKEFTDQTELEEDSKSW
jgi:hypothetical protein